MKLVKKNETTTGATGRGTDGYQMTKTDMVYNVRMSPTFTFLDVLIYKCKKCVILFLRNWMTPQRCS